MYNKAMSCIKCFFNPEHQNKLKRKTFHLDKFESRLLCYKKLFIDELKKLTVDCSCNVSNSNHTDAKNYTKEYLKTLQSLSPAISEFFDALIGIYKSFIEDSNYAATQQFTEIIERYNLNYGISDNSIYNERLFYRARKNDGSYSINDPHCCFHIPFNERYKISNQRFSISGQPMLYYGYSIIDICKELEGNINDFTIYAFLPTYKVFKNLVLLDSIIYDKFVKNECLINVTHNTKEINSEYVEKDITKTILYEVLTFPKNVDRTGVFVEEYVLPQLYTSCLLLEKKWKGIVFRSSKDFSEIKNVSPHSRYNYNCAIFTKYNEKELYDEDLYIQINHKFSKILFDNNQKEVTEEELKEDFKNLKEENKELKTNCISYLIQEELELFDYMKNATINGTEYIKTEYGQAELKIHKQFVKVLREAMQYQYENGTSKVPAY